MDKRKYDKEGYCSRCGKQFILTRYWQKFCGKECRELMWKETGAKASEMMREEKVGD